jgi:hypothetical protein
MQKAVIISTTYSRIASCKAVKTHLYQQGAGQYRSDPDKAHNFRGREGIIQFWRLPKRFHAWNLASDSKHFGQACPVFGRFQPVCPHTLLLQGFGFLLSSVLKAHVEVFAQFRGLGEEAVGHGGPIFHDFAVSDRMGGLEFLEERLQLIRRQPQRQRSVRGEKTEHGPVGGSVRDTGAFALNFWIGGDEFFV